MKSLLALGSPSELILKILLVVMSCYLFCNSSPLKAEVFYAQDEALKLAFPEATSVERRTFVLTEDQVKEVQQRSQSELSSKIFTFYEALDNTGSVMGYAGIISQRVRTQSETIMVVLTSSGEVKSTVVLAFNEPPEYIASKHWLKQFEGQDLSSNLKLGDDITGIVGSTLTASSITKIVRQVLALHQVLIKRK